MNSLVAQVVIAEELFDEANGSTSGAMTDGSVWVASPPGECDTNAGLFEVDNGTFAIQDVEGFNCCGCSGPGDPNSFCGDNQNELFFQDIDISTACGDVRIQLTWSSTGNMECEPGGPFTTCEGGHDQVVAEYSVDGAAFVTFGYFCGNTVVQFPNTGFNITGNSLDIRITGGNQAGSELYSIESVIVDYEDANCCPTGTLTGMAELCPGECEDLTWNVSGGQAPYNLAFEISAGAFSLTEGLPGLPAMGNLTVCYDDGGGIPSFDAANNTLNITDFFGTSYSLELVSITDDLGCTEMLTGQVISVTLNDPPAINTIPAIEVCEEIPGPIQVDLSLNDAAIGGGEIVEYYEDMALTMPIGPIYSVTTNTTIYAIVNDGNGCVSSSIAIAIDVSPLPMIDNPGPIQSCGEYILPDITGDDLTSTVAYWSGSNQSGSSIAEGTPITTDGVIFIYDEGNGCPSEIFFSIDILQQPEITQVPAVNACGSYTLPAIQGFNLSGNESYNSLPNGGGLEFFEGDVITESSILYLYDVIGLCDDEVVLIVNITDGPEINMPDTLSACDGLVLPDVSGEDLSASASYFSAPNGGGTEYAPGTTITDDIVLYAFDGDMDCNDEQELIVIIPLSPQIDAFVDAEACNFYVLPEITGANLINPIYCLAGNQQISADSIFGPIQICDYIKDINEGTGLVPSCMDSVEYCFTIIGLPNAGDDISFNDCGGSAITLDDVLALNAETGGIFEDPLNSGVITGNTLDASQITGDSFDFLYIVENMCGSDTSDYTLNITDQSDAGNNTSSLVCEDEFIELVDYISDADPGGIFVNTQTQAVESIINTNTIVDAGGTLLFYYIVGQGGNCAPDTADVNFVIVDTPTLDLEADQESCTGIELPAINGTNLSGNETYNTEADGSGMTFNPGDSLFNSALLYVQAGSGQCATLDSVDYTLLIPEPTLIEEILCNDDTLTVNGEQFYLGNETGSQTFTTASGCDSIVEVELSFYELDTNFITEQVCWGGEFSIFGVTLDAEQSSVQLNIPLIGQNGCDSIIFVDLLFDDPLTRNIDESLCSNDSILINGVFYSENNPSGTDTVFVEGTCDTILFINVVFEESVTLLIDDTLCPDGSVVIGTETFDADNPEGVVEISGPSGCDSLVTIDLSFYEEAIGMLTGTFCANEVIDTLGQTFDIDNPEMEIVLFGASAQNCDSTVFVSFDFDQVDEGFLDTVVCEPVDVLIGGQIFNQDSPTGQVILTSLDGCDSILNVMYSIEAVEFDATVFDASCGDENGFIVINSATSEGPYSYALDFTETGTFEIGDTIFGISPGDHNITFITIGMDLCTDMLDFTIEEADDFTIDIPAFAAIDEGGSFSLDIPEIDGFDITWSPPTGISCTDCSNPEFNPTETTQYFVTVSDGANCSAVDSILIRVELNFDTYIPNVFTPNQDGLNDVFLIFSESDINYDLWIYDRWGNRVFEGLDLITNDTSTGWDGTFNSSQVSQGVYAYKALLQIEEGEEPVLISGTITIAR